MSDLISREMVIDTLKQTGIIQDNDLGHLVIEEIHRMPTAYSVDKIVEELEELDVKSITRYKDGNFGDFDGVEYYIKKREAIEIVKQGSVSDDECEWNQNKGGVGLKAYKISCFGKTLEMPASTARGLKYCPYCGRKIKVVE